MTADPTVSTGDIARLGRVGRAAVSNWRRRHDDFPAPVSGTASNPRFALSEVEDWLRRNGKRYRLSAADRAWQRLISDGADFLLPERLAVAGAYLLDRHHPELAHLLPGDAPPLDDPALAALLDDMAARRGPAGAYEDLCGRYRRPAGEPPDALATAMARIALPDGGSVLDPACATGALLLVTGADGARGQEADPATARIAATRLLLAGSRTESVAVADALRHDAFAGQEFDAVVSAPPVVDRTWPHDALAGDARFAHGLPPRTEPELAWVQHGLAHVRPGGRVVLRLPAAVAARRPGRRIRANLLRAGVLRAVLTIEDETRPADVWVLRRPEPGDQVPSRVLLARGHPETAAELWEAFAAGRAVREGARAVPVVELLDDEVDLSPEHHLRRRASAEAGRRVAELLATGPADLPVLRVVDNARDRSSATVAELARRGMVTVRHAPRETPAPEPDDGGVAVLTVSDLATGTTPTGRTATAAGRIRVRAGDVVGAPMGRARVADRPAVLGPALTAYRMDPDQLDPEYLAGILRSTPAPGGVSSRYGHRVRVPLLPIGEQRALGAAFRGLLAAADAARAAAERADILLRLGGEGLVEGWLRPG
ncbi:SAM-dependent methyltransferase [Pseudonocardia sp. DSM 110487]|uniref:N-6 DNA methylase n=1 Tax=Pseudonocardia sp. DSM 110487 TaxID=2865833 RepID=UPI001C69AA38|nr:N-6 DNA methylase [Pseudonocardia sp. DSM 110487]QYN37285.1 SAM-dependent methyltransferase [Pseudonocardia sp. DSM 110487]